MDFDFDETAASGLRRYVHLVTRALGMTGECSYVDVDRPATAYLALDGRLARFPERDLALLWNAEHGWSVAVETDSAEDPLVLARMGGAPVPPPGEVAEWMTKFLRAEHDGRPVPAAPGVHDQRSGQERVVDGLLTASVAVSVPASARNTTALRPSPESWSWSHRT